MKFEEALAAMREGKKVKEVGYSACFDLTHLRDLDLVEAMHSDWEIYEEPKWRPEGGLWLIHDGGYVGKTSRNFDNERNFGTLRKNKEQAEKARDKMRVFNRLLAYVDEHAPDYEPDWGASNEKKWFVFYDHPAKQWDVGYCTLVQRPSCIFMPNEVAIKLADDLNSWRVVL